MNYPLSYCCNRVKNKDTILGVKNVNPMRDDDDIVSNKIKMNDNMLVFMRKFLQHIFKHIKDSTRFQENNHIKHEIAIICSDQQKTNISVIENTEKRMQYIQNGKDIAFSFMWYLQHYIDVSNHTFVSE